MDEQPNTKPISPGAAKAKKDLTTAELAMELPFTIVGAALVGGVLGYFLDHWLHTRWIFMLILGGIGFAGGVREALRRLP